MTGGTDGGVGAGNRRRGAAACSSVHSHGLAFTCSGQGESVTPAGTALSDCRQEPLLLDHTSDG